MASDEKSLGHQPTYGGGDNSGNVSRGPQSLGDQATYGDVSTDGGTAYDDGMEVVDLEARYKIEGTLGKGGMGTVLLATDTRLNRKVAIKRILGAAAESKTAVSRFLTEAQSLASVGDHPNIVQVYDYGRAADGPFLIMELVEGKSLLEKCSDGAIGIDEAVRLTCQLLDGLGKAHAAGIIHRDIKPANVLLTKDGIPKLTDFGLAKVDSADSSHTMIGAVIGTLDFMPPEQRRDAALTDHRSDLWSLAATLYQMVTRKSPKVIKLRDLPTSFADVLGKALEDAKEDRYQSAQDFREALIAAVAALDTRPEETAVDLLQGECPECRARNDPSRKFCKGCGGQLDVSCLKCDASIPVWDEFCGNCGAKQSGLLDEWISQNHAPVQASAELLYSADSFDEAIATVESLRKVTDPRLRNVKKWADEFVEMVNSEKEVLRQHAEGYISEAKKHCDAHDYSAALKTLQQIHPGVETTETKKFAFDVQSLCDEVSSLSSQIRQRVDSKEITGLLPIVERYLELKPANKHIAELRIKLLAREEKQKKAQEEALAHARTLYEAGDEDGCMAYIAGLPEGSVGDALSELRANVDALRGKRRQIHEDFNAKQYRGLLSRVQGYLVERPDDEEIKQIADHLSARDAKLDKQLEGLIKSVAQVRAAGDFANALSILDRVPEDKWDARFASLKQELEDLKRSRDNVFEQLKAAETRQRLNDALQAASIYQRELSRNTGLDELVPLDAFLQKAAATAQARLTALNAAAAIRRRRLKLKVYVACACIGTAFVGAALYELLRPRNYQRIEVVSNRRALGREFSEPSSDGVRVGSEPSQTIPEVGDDVRQSDSRYGKSPPLAVAPFDADEAGAHQQAWARHMGSSVQIENSLGMKFVAIPAGTFLMGAEDGDLDEQPVHGVTITRPYYLGVAEVTNRQWEMLMGDVPSKWRDADRPVESVSWEDAVRFCRRLTASPAEQAEGRVYRLPTEAEWEYACRAGTSTEYSCGEDDSLLVDFAWYAANSGRQTHPVGQKRPNAWGLYDMHGNVWEWCSDSYGSYAAGPVRDPAGPSTGSARVLRGGYWGDAAGNCRSASRNAYDPSNRNVDSRTRGFRLALSPSRASSPENDVLKGLGSSQAVGGVGDGIQESNPEDVRDVVSRPVAAAPVFPSAASSHQNAGAVLGRALEVENSIGMQFVRIPAGQFIMGEDGKETQHTVTLTEGFAIGVHEVTNGQWQAVMGGVPSKWRDAKRPVERVSWADANDYCVRLSSLPEEMAAGRTYRLPTEAEWEYAAKGGTVTSFSFGDDAGMLSDYGWYDRNSQRMTHPVGEKAPNPWGLFDIHGNVHEWCSDWFGDLDAGIAVDPVGAKAGTTRVLKGGSWLRPADDARSARRHWYEPSVKGEHIGLRVVMISNTDNHSAAHIAPVRREKKDIFDTAVGVEAFSTLVALVKATVLVDILKGNGPFTVFAPTDEAFGKLPEGTVEALLKPENKDKLVAVLTYHVVAGKVMAADIVKLNKLKTVQGGEVDISVADGKVKVDNANVVKTDIECSNGVIHVIDAVILP